MKALLLILALFCGAAFATDRNPQPGPSTSTATSNSAATSNATGTASAGSQSNAAGGSVQSGNAWAVALPGHASPSYAGNYSICVNGRGIGWNFVWSWAPDMECVKLIAELERLNRTPVPAAKVELLTNAPAGPTAPPTQRSITSTGSPGAPISCAPPAKAKSVAAAKASGACKG